MAAATKVPEVRDITRVERIGKQTHVLETPFPQRLLGLVCRVSGI